MNNFLLLHPIGQFIALLCGLLNLLALRRKKPLNRSLHINFGVMYYFLSLLGAVTGFIVYLFFFSSTQFYMVVHGLTGILIVMTFSVGAVTGFKMLNSSKSSNNLRRYHKFANILSLFIFLSQGVTAALWMLTDKLN